MPTMLGKQLRAEREKRKQTVLCLAEACGISHSHITLIETGKRLPGKKVIKKIATALDIPTETLLTWYLEDISQKVKADLTDS